MLNDRRGIGSQKVLDRLWHTIFTQEGPRLSATHLGMLRVDRVQQTSFLVVDLKSSDEYISHSRFALTLIRFSTAKFNVDKVNLQLLGRLDTDQQGGTTTSGHHLIGKVDTLEDQSEGTLLQRSNIFHNQRFLLITNSLTTALTSEVSVNDLDPFWESYKYLANLATASVSVWDSNM